MGEPLYEQGSLFEEDYLVRTLGSLANVPDIALTELVANAWDAGASKVLITIPDKINNLLVIEDDGVGLTTKQFRLRWMTLGYNRVKHQGEFVEFPPERDIPKRLAYGRNGVGRHGMLCFANRYIVETWRDGMCSRFIVTATSGKDPFSIVSEEFFSKAGHGTKLTAHVGKNIPNVNKILNVLSARFLYDPQFEVIVNGQSVPLEDHKGLIEKQILKVSDNILLEVFVIDSSKTARTTQQHGVAFWVGNRLVGEPSWAICNYILEDGRTRFAKRHTIVVKTNDLYNDILPDWTGFRYTESIKAISESLDNYITSIKRKYLVDRVEETKVTVLRDNIESLAELKPLGQHEVSQFIEEITYKQPDISPEALKVAVEAVINIEKSRYGISLIQKLSKLSVDDIDSLNKILDDWSVKDVLTVLDEIERRISVIDALEKLSSDKSVDELKTLHPLITQARWLFGPEFDSPMYTSNITLRNAVDKLFGAKVDKNVFINYKNRPDIIVLQDSTLSAVCTDDFDEQSGLCKIQKILIIEVKRGGFKIGRDEVNQANGYVEDLYSCGLLDGPPYIYAYVVGHEYDSRTSVVRRIGNQVEYGKVEVCTYGQLIRTASRRLFGLREQLTEKYKKYSSENLVQKALSKPQQVKMDK